MVREHQSYRHKTHEFLHVNKDILRQKQDNSTTKTKLSCSKNKTIDLQLIKENEDKSKFVQTY